MNRGAMMLAFLACAVLVMLPALPLQADLILAPEEGGHGTALPSDNAAENPIPPLNVGTLLSGDEWYEIPIGAAAMIGSAVGIYIFVTYYFYRHE
jgi:hypothetical protein